MSINVPPKTSKFDTLTTIFKESLREAVSNMKQVPGATAGDAHNTLISVMLQYIYYTGLKDPPSLTNETWTSLHYSMTDLMLLFA